MDNSVDIVLLSERRRPRGTLKEDFSTTLGSTRPEILLYLTIAVALTCV